jgi:serine/threonine protein kinase
MGEVYRARDTKLGRDVALKILPDTFAADPERLARFQREAQVLASLNHPHIGAIYGLEESDGVRALVLELVEGPTLADRIAQGAIPLDEALPIAKQIAEALEAAHEQGVIHRDLKPANIKVRPDGTVKVLDFGLAKLTEAPAASGAVGLSQSPTITTPAMTGVGTILGTAAYMSPEQAKGRPADKRSDVWAFGCVLYEMLTGERAFEGEDVSDTLAAVLRGDPDWTTLPGQMPSSIRMLLDGCLKKDRKQRFGDISTALFLMREPNEIFGRPSPLQVTPRPVWKRAIPVVAASVVVSAIVGIVAWNFRLAATPPSVTRFPFTLAEGQQFTNTGRHLVSISPDGTQMVYVANRQLYLRSLSDLDARPIAGTDTGAGVTNPVFSPDGRSIAFYSISDQTLKRISVNGGAAVTICEAGNPFGVSWDRDSILFGQGSRGILRVSANGGKPELLVPVSGDGIAHGPQMLPDGQTVLFTLAAGSTPERWDKAKIVAHSLKSGHAKTLIDSGSDGRYVTTGHIVYALGGVLFAIRFDPRRLETAGGPVPIVEGVARANGGQTGAAHFSFATNGSLIYVPGPAGSSAGQYDLALLDRKGVADPLKIRPNVYEFPRVSPDGKRLAVGTDDGKEANIWIYDVAGTTSIRQLTFGGKNRFPVWSATSQRVAFQSDREGDLGIFWQAADGTGTAERLTTAEKGTTHVPGSWSPDGSTLLFELNKGSTTFLRRLALRDKKMAAFDNVESTLPISPVFSPDGRWVAYASNGGATGVSVFVQPYPATGAKYLIASGFHPLWSPDGKELIFPATGGLQVVSTSTTPAFAFRNSTPISPGPLRMRGPNVAREFDISRDGQRVIGVMRAGLTQSALGSAPQVQVVLNWFEELKARVPTK